MTYLETIQDMVKESHQDAVDAFKVFMEDVCVPQFTDSIKGPVAITGVSSLRESNINSDKFLEWLEEEGFEVNEVGGVISISY